MDERTITPENFWEIVPTIDTRNRETATYTVRADVLLYCALCVKQVQDDREAKIQEVAALNEATFKPANAVPKHYRKIADALDGEAWEYNGLKVIRSGEERNGKKWIHVSFSRKSKMPSYDDMVRVKRDFIGEHGKAIMVLPEAKNHVNIHPFCLHLYHCEGDDGLPEFSWGGTI